MNVEIIKSMDEITEEKLETLTVYNLPFTHRSLYDGSKDKTGISLMVNGLFSGAVIGLDATDFLADIGTAGVSISQAVHVSGDVADIEENPPHGKRELHKNMAYVIPAIGQGTNMVLIQDLPIPESFKIMIGATIGLVSCIAAPLIVSNREENRLREEHRDIIEAIIPYSEQIIENTVTDPLRIVGNRRDFHGILEHTVLNAFPKIHLRYSDSRRELDEMNNYMRDKFMFMTQQYRKSNNFEPVFIVQ